ncbi:hypothetical protein MKX08_003751 [Trichoderma sp. CBMAI-0020]|nr:hypothetical protein MKX08_003751 [Trichoderma sp. CBMAI-0020]
MAKKKLSSSPARSSKRTKLDEPQETAPGSQAGSARTRCVEPSSSPPPPTSSSPTKTGAGQYERSKRKTGENPDGESSKELAAKQARAGQSPSEPTNAEAGPLTSRNRNANESTPLQILSPRTRARQSIGLLVSVDVETRLPFESMLVPVGRRAEQEEEASDSEESGSESPSSEGHALWPGVGSPDPNYVPPPDRTYSLGYLTHLSAMETVGAVAEESPSPEPKPHPWDLLVDAPVPWDWYSDMSEYRPRRPRGPLGSPSPSPPQGVLPRVVPGELAQIASRQSAPSPVPSPAERRPEARNRVSRPRSGRRSGRRSATPATASQNPPPQRQTPKKKAKKDAKKDTEEADKTQDQKCPPPLVNEDFVSPRRSARRVKGCD